MVITAEQWNSIRAGLRFGQRLRGRVVQVPRPGTIGVFVDVGLPVGGFVDVLLLPRNAARWPAIGTESEFEVWWADSRPQIRLKPVGPAFLREDFTAWQERVRPIWPAELGNPVLTQG
jgi:hypothetical protein